MNIKFRENWTTHKVEIFVDDVFVGAYREYMWAAEMVRRNYHLSDKEMIAIYQDYKNDIDS